MVKVPKVFKIIESDHSRRRRGGGRGGGRPPFGSKRRKTSKIWANSLFIWAAILFIWAHDWQKTVSVSVKTFFFFFFGEHLNFDRKTVQILTEKGKLFFGQKFVAPPNHLELLRP